MSIPAKRRSPGAFQLTPGRSSVSIYICERHNFNFFTTITHQHIHLTLFFEYFNKTQHSPLPYSPDTVPYNFWLFPKLKSPLKKKRFEDVEEIKQNTTRQLQAIPKTELLQEKKLLQEVRAALEEDCSFQRGVL